MALSAIPSQGPQVTRGARVLRTRPAAEWSFVAATEPDRRDDHLIFVRLHLDSLRIDDLATEVAASSNQAEAIRWRRARAQEFALRLRDRLRLHLPSAEISVYVHEGPGEDRLKVILASFCENAAQIEATITDRAEAINRQTWTDWWEGLRITMSTLHQLEHQSA